MKKVPKTKKEKQGKMEMVMHEFKHGALHSGSKKGPTVKKRAQAIAIALKQSGQSYKRKSKKKRDAAAALAK